MVKKRVQMQKDGKLNLRLFLFMVLFVVFAFAYVVLGIVDNIELISPENNLNTSNLTLFFACNASRGNFTNISLWANDNGTWMMKGINMSTENFTVQTFNISFPNTTNNVTFSWNCRVANNSVDGLYNFSAVNYTVHVDAVPPAISPIVPGSYLDPTQTNFTDMPILVNVTVTDERVAGIHSVWAVIAERAISPYGANLTLFMMNVTNTSSNLGAVYAINITPSFTDNRTSPGAHAVWFCANDTAGNVVCGNNTGLGLTGLPYLMVIRGANLSQMQSALQINSSTLKIFLTNGSNAYLQPGANHFFDPIAYNYTFMFNFTDAVGRQINVSIVGMRINETVLAAAAGTQIESRTGKFDGAAGGQGFNTSVGWVDVASFIPSFALYRYGVVAFSRLSDRKYYCNGTLDSPTCNETAECSGAVNPDNADAVIPTGTGCWRTEGTKTILYVDHFTGAAESTDVTPPNLQIRYPVDGQNFSSGTNILINVSFNDTGVGLDNESINITVHFYSPSGPNYNASLVNSLMTCSPTATENITNTTVYCWALFNLSESLNGSTGTWVINSSVRDGNDQQANLTNISIYVDTSAPAHGDMDNFRSMFITTNSTFWHGNDNTPGSTLVNSSRDWAVAEGTQINMDTLWNESITGMNGGRLEFYNTSAGAWQIANHTNFVAHVQEGKDIPVSISWKLPSGHNWFGAGEKNVSLRLIANDTVGNENITANFTILVNDTTIPTVTTFMINGSNNTGLNISSSRIKLNFTITEAASLRNVFYQIDGAFGASNVSAYLVHSFNSSTYSQSDVDSLKTSEALLNATVPSQGADLSEGNHTVNLTVIDDSNNVVSLTQRFLVDNTFPSITLEASVADPVETANNTNITQQVYFNASGSDAPSSSGVKSRTYFTSCNTTAAAFTNRQIFQPFNTPDCLGRNGTFTLTINVTDYVGHQNISVYQYRVDDVAPAFNTFTVSSGAPNNTVTWDASDAFNRISNNGVGWYLDSNSTLFKVQGDKGGVNSTTYNFASGLHTIKMSVNDTAGNRVNSSEVAFQVVVSAQTNYSSVPRDLVSYIRAATGVNSTVYLKIENGTFGFNGTDWNNQTIEINIQANTSAAEVINITLRVNGTQTSFGQNFSVYLNHSAIVPDIERNYRLSVRKFVLMNHTLDRIFFTNDSYFGMVEFADDIGGDFDRILWFPSATTFVGEGFYINISSCDAAGLSNIDFNNLQTSPCYNSSGGKTKVFVPHFGAVVAANDSQAPNVTIISPATSVTTSTFLFNISVSPDATSCVSYFSRTADNSSMTISGDYGGFKYCYSAFVNARNSAAGVENVTFYVRDASNNVNLTIKKFNVSDSTTPNTAGRLDLNATSSSRIQLSWNATEKVNSTVNYGTTNALGTSTESTSITELQSYEFTGLSGGTAYFFNITYCDYQGNCRVNGTFNTTTETAGAEETPSAGVGGGGGGGGGVGALSNVLAKASRFWSSLPAGTEASIDVENDKIAITEVSASIINDIVGATLYVMSLKEKPAELKEAAANVYQYLEIKPQGFESTDISSVAIKFKVSKQWLKDNKLSDSQIVLYRHTGSGWAALDTAMTKFDDEFVYYSASSPAFSYYAIGTQAAALPIKPVEEKPVPPAEVPEVEKPAEVVTPPPAKISGKLIATIAVIAILILALIGYYIYERRRPRHPHHPPHHAPPHHPEHHPPHHPEHHPVHHHR